MAIQDNISNFFDSMLQSAQSSARRSANEIRQATNILPELDPMTRASLEMHYQPQQYGSIEEAMLFDPLLVDRVMKAYEQQASGLLDGGDYPDATMIPDTSGAVPRPRPPAPRRTFPQTIPTQSLSDAELMQFESVPYARANEIQTMIDQIDALQGGKNPGGVSTAGLADDEMVAGFNPAQREAYARMVRDMAGTSGAANMRPDGAEPRSALVNSQLQAQIDRERGANRGRVGSSATAEDESRAAEFGALASTGAGNLVKGGIKGAQAVQAAGGLRALLNRIGLGNLARARQATKGRFMRDPVTGRMIGAKDIGPQPPTQLQRMMLQAESGGVPKGAYADGGRLRDGVMDVYDRM
jgi:hypothetical protein